MNIKSEPGKELSISLIVEDKPARIVHVISLQQMQDNGRVEDLWSITLEQDEVQQLVDLLAVDVYRPMFWETQRAAVNNALDIIEDTVKSLRRKSHE